MKKAIFLFILFISSFFTKTIYAANEYIISSFENVYGYGVYSTQNCDYNFTKNLTLSNKNIKMTQDDNFYMFEISAVASLNENVKNEIYYESKGHGNGTKGSSSYYGWNGYYTVGDDGIKPNSIGERYSLVKNRLTPIVYKKKNFTDDIIEWYSDFSISNAGNIYNIYDSLYIGTEQVSGLRYSKDGSDYTYSTKEENFFMNYPIKEIKPFYGFTLPVYNPNTDTKDLEWTADTMLKKQDGFTLLSNSCSLKKYTLDENGYIEIADYNVAAKIKIKKSMFSNYRYFAFGGLTFITDFIYCNDYISRYNGIFSSTDTIDLNEYVSCNHNWEYSYTEKSTSHKMTCKNCNWTKTETHNYQYEYDGIVNNLCACGCNKKVKYIFIINDDKTKEIIKTYNTYSTYEKYEAEEKTGYTFKIYEKYEEQIKNDVFSTTKTELKEVKLANVNEMSEKTGNYSVKYKAIWTPNKYTFKYSNINNLSISLPETPSNQVFTYDESQKIKSGQNVEGYIFRGWSNIKNSSEVLFTGEESIKNYTKINNDVITLYPVYTENEYIIKYSCNNKYNKEIEEIPEQRIKYSKSAKLKKAKEIEGYIFKGWSKTYDSEIVEYKDEEEVIKISSVDGAIITIYPIYEPIKYVLNYSEKSNIKELQLISLENQTFIYDEEQKIKKGQDVIGYTFKGWSLINDSSEIKYVYNEQVKNLTNLDNDVITLYPVYIENEYIIRYSNKNKYNKKIKIIPEQIIKYSKSEKLKKAKEIEGYIFKGWSKTYDSEIVEYKDEEEIIKLSSTDKDIITLYPIYEPIKYIINYSGLSNINIASLTNLEKQICIYDKEYKIKKGIPIEKYNFLGWSKTKNSKSIDFKVNDKIFNYTNINKKEIVLYPVYFINNIRIKYFTSKGRYNDKSNTITQDIKYNDKSNLILPYGYSSDESYFMYYKTNIDEKTYTKMIDVKNLMAEKNITEITLFACFNKNQYGKIERTKDGLSPNAEGGFIKKDDLISEKKEKFIDIEKNDNIEKEKQNKVKNNGQQLVNKIKGDNIKKYNNEIKKKEEIEIFDMTKSELQKIYEILGIKKATISDILKSNKYEIYGNIVIIKSYMFFYKYKKQILLFIICIVIISTLFVVKKRK